MSVINLREYMKRVYTELENYIEGLSEEERVRFVTEFHDMFDSGTADYDDEHITALYVMKYARAYGFQFSRAYADIFADMNNPESIKAVSIGCGTGIDYWGMSYAARVLGEAPESKLDYTGIDPVCWPYRITEAADMPEQDMVRYNEITSGIHDEKGSGHPDLFHEPADEIKSCTDFNEYLGYMENRPGEPLSDIYFFPHSTKEVCIHTVPNDVEDMAATLLCAYERSSKEHIPCDAKAADRNARTAGYAASKEIDRDNPSKTKTQSDKRSTDAKGILSSPAKIYEYLDRRVYGQKEAKKAAAMLLWNHVNGRRQNVLFAGPTGCGKTEIFRQLAKLYPNIVIHNATSLTGTGWKGNTKVRNLFDGVDQDKMSHLVIILDEADKMFEDADDRHYSYIVQNELLKVLEGDMVHFDGNPSNSEPALDIDTSNVSFVFLGSFDSMVRAKAVAVNKSRAIGFGAVSSDELFDGYMSTFTQEDLVQYANVRCEIAGRIGNIVQLREMTEDDFYAILNDKRISPVRKLSDYYGVKLKM